MSTQIVPKNSIFVLDIGNTNAKLRVFSNQTWNSVAKLRSEEYDRIQQWLSEMIQEKDAVCIWTSVVESVSVSMRNLTNFETIELSRSKIPLDKLNYDTPQTLGIDRFLACLGAYTYFNSKPVIVVDAGTAVTIDAMNSVGVFEGGVIAPGLRLWEESLTEFAPALPRVEREIPPIWPPKSTKTALQWGLSGGFYGMIEGFLAQWKNRFPDAVVFFTGGDGEWLQSRFMSKSFGEEQNQSTNQKISNGVHQSYIFDPYLVEKGCLQLIKKAVDEK